MWRSWDVKDCYCWLVRMRDALPLASVAQLRHGGSLRKRRVRHLKLHAVCRRPVLLTCHLQQQQVVGKDSSQQWSQPLLH